MKRITGKVKNNILLLFILIIMVLAFSMVPILLDLGIIWFVYPDKNEFTITGIDISHYQLIKNWKEIKKHGIDFVYIKATEGDDFVDSEFQENWKNSKDHSILRGAYHFYSLRFDGKSQAQNFIKNVPVEKNILPPVIDLEFGGNSKVRPKKEELINELKIFSKMIEDVYHKKPILYATDDFYEKYISGELKDHKIWTRNILYKPGKFKDERDWTFWQYKNRGVVKGIHGFVDLNVFKGSKNDFDELLK